MTTLDLDHNSSAHAVADPPVARRHFLSWVRDGLAGRIPDSAADPGGGPLPARAVLSTGLTVNGVTVTGPQLALHGPGDVVGLDLRQIVRLEPPQHTTDFEPEHLAAIDFDDPDLPWRLTPASPHPQHGLRPWIVLVVLDLDTEGVSLGQPTNGRLPVLTAPAAELPDLAQSASWAHAEITAIDGEDLQELLRTRPERSVSRLLAPRVLVAGRHYVACVVPAFAHGVVAGLGGQPEGVDTAPAWSGSTGTVTLPVYHSWTFRTGPDGDFPTLAGRLRPTVADPGRRTFSYLDADPELPGAVTTVLPALHAAGAAPDQPADPAWTQAMHAVLARGATELTPPVYLAAHTGRGRGWSGDEPPWLAELNGDPRLRAAAGIGADVVRRDQESLLASAWRQAADLQRCNEVLRQGQLAQAVSESLHRRHFAAPAARLAADADAGSGPAAGVLVSRGAAALRRLPAALSGALSGAFAAASGARSDSDGGAGTIAGGLDSHPATAGTVAQSAQRALRPTGPAARAAGASSTAPLGSAVEPVASAAVVPAPPVQASADTGVLDRMAGQDVRYRGITGPVVQAALPWWRGWAQPGPANRPLVTPGPHGYLADVVVVDQAPTGAVTVTVNRELDFDGRIRRPGTAFPLPHPAGAPAALRLCGATLARGYDPQPALLLLYRDGEHWDARQHYVRWVRGVSASGYQQASPLVPLGAPMVSARDVDLTVRRTTTYDNEVVQEVVACWADPVWSQLFLLCVRTEPWSGPDGWHDLRTVHIPAFSDPENSPAAGYAAVAVDWVPKPFDGTYRQPTDLLVAWLVEGMEYHTGENPVWRLQYCVVRNVMTGNDQVGPVHDGGYLGERTLDGYDDGFWPRLAVTVTDVDGNGQLEVLAHFTSFTLGAGGAKTWRSTQHVCGQINPVTGAVSAQAAPIGAPVPAGPLTVHVLGDVDERRLARLSQLGDRFQSAAVAHQTQLVRPATAAEPAPGAAPYSIAGVATEVAGTLDPAAAIPHRVLDRIRLDGQRLPDPPDTLSLSDAQQPDPLRPRYYEPQFPQPMSDPLRELFGELAFPAADAVPDDGVSLLAGNSALIAAYLAGINDEFGRELLWRGFPSTGKATWFRRFFDSRGAAAATDGDIRPIAEWGQGELADAVTGIGGQDSVTLLVRGQLVRRFPRVVVQAIRAQWAGSPPVREPLGQVQPPTFTGQLGPDLTLFSFPLPADELRGGSGDPGWFFCFAQPPTESRFGAAAGQQWNRPGAHQAAALLRLPYRVAVHASDLLAPVPSLAPTPSGAAVTSGATA